MTQKQIKVTLVRSVIGTKQSHRDTVRGLGLRRINHSRVLLDTPEVRGMIHKVNYLVTAVEVVHQESAQVAAQLSPQLSPQL